MRKPARALAFVLALLSPLLLATVPVTTSSVSYAGNGATTAFAVPFPYLDKAHVVVKVRAATGVVTVKTLTTHYTLTSPGASGTVTMITAPATGETLTIERTVPYTQTTNFRTQGTFAPGTHENALDKATMGLQQLDRRVTQLEDGGAQFATSFTANTITFADGGVVSPVPACNPATQYVTADGGAFGCVTQPAAIVGVTNDPWQRWSATCSGAAQAQWYGPGESGGATPYTSPAGAQSLVVAVDGVGQVCVNPLTVTAAGYGFLDFSSRSAFPLKSSHAVHFWTGSGASSFFASGVTTWFGMQENCGSSCGCFNQTTTPGGSYAMAFRYTSGSDAAWRGCNMSGGIMECCDTGITPAANTLYTLEVRQKITTVEYWVNGVLGCSNAARVPNSNLGYVCFSVKNGAGASVTGYFDAVARAYGPVY